MKKLVTIVSAVMMLLMLAACAPSTSLDADTIKTLQNAAIATNSIIQWAADCESDERPESIIENGSWTVTADADDKTTVSDYTIAKDTTVTTTISDYVAADAEKKASWTVTYTIEGTASWKDGADTITVEVKTSYALKTTDGEPSYSTYTADYLYVDGKAYDPYDYYAVMNLS